MGLKERAYVAAGSASGARVLAALGSRVRVPHLRRAGSARHPLLVVVTIDTEAGYVADDEQRVWQGRAPDAYVGFAAGVANITRVLARHRAPATFLVAPHFTSAPAIERDAARDALLRARDRHSEIGLHLHPTSDRALARALGAAPETRGKDACVRTAKRLLDDALGVETTSFRWGNWALDAEGARAVADAGFRVDSSAVPGLVDPRRRPWRPARYDWRACTRHEAWRMSRADRSAHDPASPLLAVPIATFECVGVGMRADPLFGSLLGAALARYRAEAPRDERPFAFVLMTHSSEATHEDGRPTRVVRDLDAFLTLARACDDVEIVTLRDGASRVDPSR